MYRTLHEDKEAFGTLVRLYTPVFYTLLRKMIPNQSIENSEDDLQEIFLRIYRALPLFRSENSFFSWSYTIAVNWIRSQNRKTKVLKQTTIIPYDEDIRVLQGSQSLKTPEQTAIASEAEQLLVQALQTLKNEYREVFVLRMMQGLSVSETARILKIPEGTVKTYLYRSRKELQRWMTEHQWNLQND